MSSLVVETPPPGTMCVDCKCCAARIYAATDPVCWECDAGKPCKGKQPAPTSDNIAKVQKLADSNKSSTHRTSMTVAKLLKPKRPYRKRIPIMVDVLSDPDVVQGVDPKPDFHYKCDDKLTPEAQALVADLRRDSQLRHDHGLTAGAAAGDHYDHVIQDLAMKKIEIERTITFLRAMQLAAR
jgi:hypothetical protein